MHHQVSSGTQQEFIGKKFRILIKIVTAHRKGTSKRITQKNGILALSLFLIEPFNNKKNRLIPGGVPQALLSSVCLSTSKVPLLYSTLPAPFGWRSSGHAHRYKGVKLPPRGLVSVLSRRRVYILPSPPRPWLEDLSGGGDPKGFLWSSPLHTFSENFLKPGLESSGLLVKN